VVRRGQRITPKSEDLLIRTHQDLRSETWAPIAPTMGVRAVAWPPGRVGLLAEINCGRAAACQEGNETMQTTAKIRTHNLGYPRIGERRELKRATEAFWNGTATEAELLATAAELRRNHWQKQQALGIDLIPSNDFSFYDQMGDTVALVGCVPRRFGWSNGSVDLTTYFKMARGESVGTRSTSHTPGAAVALEMTKWFDTNYHYLVPEFDSQTLFRLATNKPVQEFREAVGLGIRTKPVLIGPATFLRLGKSHSAERFNPLALLDRLLPVYGELLELLAAEGAEWVQLDEPIFALDLTASERTAILSAYTLLRSRVPQLRLLVASYFGDLRENLLTYAQLPVDGLHLDAVRAPHEVDRLLEALPPTTIISLGVVDGRNVWLNDFSQSLRLLRKALTKLGAERLWVAPSCSLLHTPVSLKPETQLDAELRRWLVFTDEKLAEVATLARALTDPDSVSDTLRANAVAQTARRNSLRTQNDGIRARLNSISESDIQRRSPFPERKQAQARRLGLPPFPTTTIGSFPQTTEVRTARARQKRGDWTEAQYDQFIESEIRKAVDFQERVGLDVLVHGEFERNDMVEYFGEQLDGFAFTTNGWVQSYGTRCVKPPLLYGDVSRPRPMTVRWSQYAAALTRRWMKGMLTGPVTVLQWSFVRDDQPREETARQIALALRDEVRDLETAGIGIIQIDEPAFREGLPLRQADRSTYLRWAVEAFRLAAAGVRDETQIHTHMCYSEFNDIIEAIAALDADVISIETSRSQMELLSAFAKFRYPADIGPGIWDIHSPRVPSVDEMENLLRKALVVLTPEQLWVNPDCGLKTRRWEEISPALQNLVEASRRLRQSVVSEVDTATIT
jgi:5-methyltetrahydropteroyltriglutamate--homocysteine methyltransferase